MSTLYIILYVLVGLVVGFFFTKHLIEEEAEDEDRLVMPVHVVVFLGSLVVWPIYALVAMGIWIEDGEPIFNLGKKGEKLKQANVEEIMAKAWQEGYERKSQELDSNETGESFLLEALNDKFDKLYSTEHQAFVFDRSRKGAVTQYLRRIAKENRQPISLEDARDFVGRHVLFT